MTPRQKNARLPCFDVWVCEGRLCTAHGADALKAKALAVLEEDEGEARARVLRGGCYGLCELAPNVIVRRFPTTDARPGTDEDRLSLTEAPNETVYCQVDAAGLETLLTGHLERDVASPELTRARREAALESASPVAARLRALRERRRQRGRRGA